MHCHLLCLSGGNNNGIKSTQHGRGLSRGSGEVDIKLRGFRTEIAAGVFDIEGDLICRTVEPGTNMSV
jgi:hypothetical protein